MFQAKETADANATRVQMSWQAHTKQARPCGQRTVSTVKRSSKNWPALDNTGRTWHFILSIWGRVKRLLTRALTCSSLHFEESLQQVYNAWLSEGNGPTKTGRVQVRSEGELALMWNRTEAGHTSKDCRHITGWVKRISWWICLWWRKRHKIHKGMEKDKVTVPG